MNIIDLQITILQICTIDLWHIPCYVYELQALFLFGFNQKNFENARYIRK